MRHLAAYADAVVGLLLGELPVIVDDILVDPRQLQGRQHSALSHHGLLLPVNRVHDLFCLRGMVAAVAHVELDDTYGSMELNWLIGWSLNDGENMSLWQISKLA